MTVVSLYSCNSNNKEADNKNSDTELCDVEIPKSEIELAGVWTSTDNLLYPILEFKGKSTVIIQDGFFSLRFVSSYERDEEFIRVKTDQSDLLFEVVSADSLTGTGFTQGVWVKEK